MKKQVKVYASFEEQAADELAYSLSLTPAQRIATTVALIKRIYSYKAGMPEKKTIKVNYHK